jgi:prophage tail gpP-like protein
MAKITEPTDYPIPGYLYTVQDLSPSDALSRIARKAYGDGKLWRRIWKANKDRARKWKNPTTGLYELNPDRSFWPGDVILIPGEKLDEVKEELREDAVDLLPADDAREFTVIIDGTEINLVSARALISMDTATDGWTAVTPFNSDNILQRELFRPYAYHPAELYVGGYLQIRGFNYLTEPSITKEGRKMGLGGWSIPADIVDSGVRSPREFKGKKLEDIARQLCEPLQIEVVWDAGDDKPFKTVSAESSDTIFSFLAGLAKQRSVQLSSTPQGRLLFTRANIDSEPVANLVEGYPPLQDISARFDGRERFNSYTAQAQSPGKKKGKKKTGVAIDEQVPRSRFKFFSADDADSGDLDKAAEWERGKQFVEAFSFQLPVTSIYSDGPANTRLWTPNTMVSLTSQTLMLDDGFDFLIRAVEYIFEREGVTAVLHLVPPQAYTGEAPPVIWEAQ